MHHSNPAEHAQHDPELIAGHAAGDLSLAARSRAETWLQSCDSCADLRRDLLAIAAATRTLPTRAVAPRDFRLDPAQAARLRRVGFLRNLLRPFGAAGSALRPIAMASTSLGLAGLLVAAVLPSLFGSAGAAAPQRDRSLGGATGAEASAGPVALPVGGQPGRTGDLELGGAGQATPPADNSDAKSTLGPVAASPGSAFGASDEPPRLRGEEPPSMPSVLVVGSLLLLTLGASLILLRFVARRVG